MLSAIVFERNKKLTKDTNYPVLTNTTWTLAKTLSHQSIQRFENLFPNPVDSSLCSRYINKAGEGDEPSESEARNPSPPNLDNYIVWKPE
jgi:hypothetical protein